MNCRTVSILVAAVAALPAAALAQSTARPTLEATAFSNANGPTVSFRASQFDIKSLSPELRTMDIGRPGDVSTAVPPTGASLGFVRFLVGDRQNPATRKIALRRRVALGGGRYSLASSDGVRVVLSTRATNAFLAIKLPALARSVHVSLTGRGARLLKFRDCTSRVFSARFVTTAGQVTRDTVTMAMFSLRRARLC